MVVKAEQVQLQRDGGVFSAGDHHGAVLALILNHQHTDAVTEIWMSAAGLDLCALRTCSTVHYGDAANPMKTYYYALQHNGIVLLCITAKWQMLTLLHGANYFSGHGALCITGALRVVIKCNKLPGLNFIAFVHYALRCNAQGSDRNSWDVSQTSYGNALNCIW